MFSVDEVDCPVIGFHPSMLPKGRGSAPIINGFLRKECGSTFFQLTDELDAGPILSQRGVYVHSDWSITQLYAAVVFTALSQISEFMPLLESGGYTLTPQDESQATYNPKRSRDEWIPYW
jgi:methionyl-tRNA formyltransferase